MNIRNFFKLLVSFFFLIIPNRRNLERCAVGKKSRRSKLFRRRRITRVSVLEAINEASTRLLPDNPSKVGCGVKLPEEFNLDGGCCHSGGVGGCVGRFASTPECTFP